MSVIDSSERWMWKQIAIGLSFANLCYLRVWSELLTYTPAQSYEMQLPPGPEAYLAAIVNVLTWGVVFGLLAALLRPTATLESTQRLESAVTLGPALGVALLSPERWGPVLRRAAQWLWLLAMLVPLNAFREVLSSRLPVGQQYLKGGLYAAFGAAGVVVLGMAAAAGGAVALRRWRGRIYAATRVAVLIFAPLVPMTLGQAGWMAYRYDPRPFADQAAGLGEFRQQLRENSDRDAQPGVGEGRPRVVWVVFDEWDQRLSFDDRPPDLDLPEIDRFRGEALAADNAIPPRTNTLESIPSLLSGRIVERAVPLGPADLRLTFAGSRGAVSWRNVGNVFDAARQRRRETALVGVYHPYCRVVSGSLTSCWWAEIPRPINSSGARLGEAMGGQLRGLFETWRLSLFGQSLSTARKAREFPAAVTRAKAVAADPAYGLVFIHLLTPHFPHAYDRASGTFTLGNAPLGGYYDSLALTDRVWGELRETIEAAGLWDTTAVLLTSDHPMKHAALLDGKTDPRVPFLLKLPRQVAGRVYPRTFNTVVTGELLLEILDGRIATADAASLWLDARAGTDERVSD